ncbi:MAG: hypothetical protein IJ418_16200 [Clostridia bacterium]|nr:hypothetical protein [Clostridia bacterium]
MINVADFTITSLDMITAYGLNGAPRFVLDELQDATIANTQEKQDITGKGGRKLNSLKKNKAVVISGNNGLVSAGLLEAQTGSQFEEKTNAPVACVDYLTINGNAATTDHKAVGTAGAEITELYIRNSEGIAEQMLEQSDAVAEGMFTYDPETKALAFAEGAFEDGTEIVVFYTAQIEATVLSNISDRYSEKLRLVVDATIENKCNTIYHLQINIPRADFSGNFDMAMGDNQTVHAFEAESLAGVCGKGGELWTYTIFGVDAADAA